MTVSNSMGEIRDHAVHAVQGSRPWIRKLAKLGYVARGALYLIVGVLALRAAFGMGGRTTDTRGALREIITQPFGKMLLVLTAVGLAGYALWRFIAAALNPEGPAHGGKSVLRRLKHLGSGVIHAGLAVSAVQLLRGVSSGGGSDQHARSWTARLLAEPFGPWLVGAVGAAIVVGGVVLLVNAVRAKFRKRLDTHRMSERTERAVTALGRAGIAARGFAFGTAGVFLVQAAMHANPSEARGLGGTLRWYAQQPFGPYLMGAVAAGLILYGVFELFEARYRRIVVS